MRYLKDMNSAVMREEKSAVFCRFGCGIDMAIYRADAQFLKTDRRQAIRECPEADPVLISDKLGRYRISDQTCDSCGKLTAAQPARVVCGLSLPRRNVRKKRVSELSRIKTATRSFAISDGT